MFKRQARSHKQKNLVRGWDSKLEKIYKAKEEIKNREKLVFFYFKKWNETNLYMSTILTKKIKKWKDVTYKIKMISHKGYEMTIMRMDRVSFKEVDGFFMNIVV